MGFGKRVHDFFFGTTRRALWSAAIGSVIGLWAIGNAFIGYTNSMSERYDNAVYVQLDSSEKKQVDKLVAKGVSREEVLRDLKQVESIKSLLQDAERFANSGDLSKALDCIITARGNLGKVKVLDAKQVKDDIIQLQLKLSDLRNNPQPFVSPEQ